MPHLTFVQRLSMLAGFCLLLAFTPLHAVENDEATIWQALRSGEGIALIRHAIAPGTGDPAHFNVGDCDTQRNLSDEGRNQAKTIGRLFRNSGLDTARLSSSQWCRCLETAQLMDIGNVTPQVLLNSFYGTPENGPSQLTGLKEWLMEQKAGDHHPLVLVTHQVVITGLTGVYPSSGEIVVIHRPTVADPAIKVIGTVETHLLP